MKLAAALALCCASQAIAETDFKALSDGERLLLGAEVRAVLLAHPEIVENAMNPPFEPYADDIASDLEMIEAHSQELFGDADLALIVGADCAECASAQEELVALAARYDLKVNIIDIREAPALKDAMQVDTLPFYVLPKMMLRGAMPDVVLERYLEKIAD